MTSLQLLKVTLLKGICGVPRTFVTSSTCYEGYKLVVVGGGTGGCATAAKFSSVLGEGKVAVIEPADVHYYQPLWTLVGGGMKDFKESGKPMAEVLPKKAKWIKKKVVEFKPENSKVVIDDGKEISYEFLVIALGLQLNYNQIPGMIEALETPYVGSNYSPKYVQKTYKAMQNFREGTAVFTFPSTPIKCAGAPQKIMYIFDEYVKKNGRRDKANIVFNSALDVLFTSKYYADALWEVVKKRNLTVNLRHNLIEIKADQREASFQNLNDPKDVKTFQYNFLHVTPPMSAPDVLKTNKELTDAAGFLNVDKETLCHMRYKNIFGIGDCTNVPTSKTAAAVAGQFGILKKNLKNAINKQPLSARYNGYTSCPLVTGYSTCILAEFDFATNPIETFPFDQRKERRTMFHMKKDLMPVMYWQAMLKGYWEGPKHLRTLMHLGLK